MISFEYREAGWTSGYAAPARAPAVLAALASEVEHTAPAPMPTTETEKDPQISSSSALTYALVSPAVVAQKPLVPTATRVFKKGIGTSTGPAPETSATTLARALPATPVLAAPAFIGEYISPPAPVDSYVAAASVVGSALVGIVPVDDCC